MYRSEYTVIFKRLAFAFVLYPVTRIIFAAFNYNYFQNISISEFFLGMLYGLRFDLSTLLIANAIFILLSTIPVRLNWYRILLKVVFVISNTIFLGINIVDAEFFKFNGKKLTADVLAIGSDINAQIFQLMAYYWNLVIMVLLMSFILWKLYPRVKFDKHAHDVKVKIWLTPVISLLALVLAFIGIRGGLQMKSISPKEAFQFVKYEVGNLALNSAYSLVRSYELDGLKLVSYYKDDEDVLNDIKKFRNIAPGYLGHPGQNIILIIIESFSQEYINEGYAPFFSELAEKGLYYDNNFANGRRSVEVLPSLLTGIPSIIGEPIPLSQYQTNKFISLPQILKKHSYDVSFFHGGKRGTMEFDSYTRAIGIDKYFGKEDYPNQDHFDGNWGIYDHHFFDYMSDYLSSVNGPFFSTIFTLSSHQPYSVPAEFNGKFPKGNLEIHESIGYVDHSLKLFFEKAKQRKWFENTLFIITADHTQKLSKKEFLNTLGQYRVPLLLFHPRYDLGKYKQAKVTQHVDVFPTVLDFLDIEESNFLPYGASVFSKDPGRMINFIGERYLYFKPPYLLSFSDKPQSFAVYDDKLEAEKLVNEVDKQMVEELKHYIQFTNNGFIKNKLFKSTSSGYATSQNKL